MRTSLRRSRVLALILSIVVLSSISQPASAQPGLGGGAQFAAGTTFPFVGGITSHIDSAMNVQNLGQFDAELEFSSNVPAGVTVEAVSKKPVFVRPGAMVNVPFRITVSPLVASGTYEVLSTIKQVNVPEVSGGTTYAPAVGTKFFIRVFGAGTNLTVKAFNIETKQSIKGILSLFYVGERGTQTLIETKVDTRLERKVVPGKYRASFEIAGLTQKFVDFEVLPKKNKVVFIGVHALEIIAVKADPKYQDDGSVNQVDLTLGLRNGIARLEGPISFSTKVYLNGELQDTWTFSTLPDLSVGITEQKARYVTGSPLSPGKWKFVFVVSTEDFKVVSHEAKPFFIEESMLDQILRFGMYAIAIGVWSFFFWLLWRRRKREDEEEEAL